MSQKQVLKTTSATLALIGMFANTVAVAKEPALTLATSTNTLGAQYGRFPAKQTDLSRAVKLALLRSKVKYVFVLFQENRSFDHYFGTYPGANGLLTTFTHADPSDPAAQPGNQTGSFTQNIRNTDGTYSPITPFLAPHSIKDVNGATLQLYPESIYSVDHSHTGMVNDMHVDAATKSLAKNDAYALDQEGLGYSGDASTTATVISTSTGAPPTSNPSLSTKQKGQVVMAHVDCDTIPFLWHYADVGTLFDNLHQTTIGPSTPNAIAMISAQGGATQWALHPSTTGSNTTPQTVPNETDSAPFAGSAADTYAGKPPYGPDEASFANCAVNNTGAGAGTVNNLACPAPLANDPAFASYTANAVVALKGQQTSYFAPQLTLTYASLPLSFMGSQISSIVAQDAHPVLDLVDVQHDNPPHRRQEPGGLLGLVPAGFRPRAVRRPGGGRYVPGQHAARLVHRAS
ncbi:MAG: alkaline phosphatase family protein [Rhodospirillales bacterium]